MDGATLGRADGSNEGLALTLGFKDILGFCDGSIEIVGESLGKSTVGADVGKALTDGVLEGTKVGMSDDTSVGYDEGCALGARTPIKTIISFFTAELKIALHISSTLT